MRDTRTQLVEAAARLFHEAGYGNTSLADVADAAGLKKGNLSYYFKSKEDLLEAVARHWWDTQVAPLTDDLTSSPQIAVDRFLSHVEGSAPLLAQHGCPVGSLAIDALRSGADCADRATAALLQLEHWLRLQLERRMAPDSAAAAAEHLLVAMQGSAVMAALHGDPGLVLRQVAHCRRWLDSLPGWRD